MTIERFRIRLQEAKTAAYEAACMAQSATVNATLLNNAINQVEPSHRADIYVKYQWACTLRDELRAATAETKKAAYEAQWSMDMVAAREMVMFDGRDTI